MKAPDDPLQGGMAVRGPTAPVPLMSQLRTALIAAALVTIGPVSLTMYTPAMPTLVEAFGTTETQVKATLTVFFFGFAFSQLVCGPLSDAFGRRPVALGFFGAYLAGSVVTVMATSMEVLIAGRLLQGIGCAAGIAISRAIVRDQYVGQASARIMNLVGTMLAIAPAISPTLGGVVLELANWHGIFVIMCLYGLLLVVMLIWFVPETNRTRNRALVSPAGIMHSYGSLLGSRVFMRAGLVIGAVLGGMYTLAALLSFVLIDTVGLTPVEFGMAMLVQTGAFIMGTLVMGRLLRRMSATSLIVPGLVLVMLSAAGLAIGLRVFTPSVLTVMGPIALWAVGVAMIMPGCTTAALSGFPHIAGAASALTGFLQIGGGMCGTLVALLFPSPLAALMTLIPAMGVLSVIAHVLLRPRTGTAPVTVVPDDEALDATNIELAVDPLGVVGASGDEIEARTLQQKR
ncbi:multidrug effflux MFS transporter [Xanthobacter sp. TB0136]|uniref:multidrug effflux MFS transporter n=1 Tax=Xanthobacter sp. TB0136 TaxID=3459177 RepID=UPI004039A3D3